MTKKTARKRTIRDPPGRRPPTPERGPPSIRSSRREARRSSGPGCACTGRAWATVSSLPFRARGRSPFQILIDCGVLARDAESMKAIVRAHPRHRSRRQDHGKARLDVVVGRTSTRTTFGIQPGAGPVQRRLRHWRRVAGLDREPHQAGDQEDQGGQEEGRRQACGPRSPARWRGRGRTRSTASPRCLASARTTTPPVPAKSPRRWST